MTRQPSGPDLDPVDMRGNERAALRRVSELVAQGAGRETVLEAIVVEAYQLFPVDFTALLAYADEGAASLVALHHGPPDLAVGAWAPHIPDGLVLRVYATGRPVRVETYADRGTPEAAYMQSLGITGGAAAPIVVDGRTWGVLTAMSVSQPVLWGLEHRLADFADIAATGIATAQAKDELRAMADEQAALRRVAEIAAQGAEPTNFFARLAEETSTLLGGAAAIVTRLDGAGASTVVARAGGRVGAGHAEAAVPIRVHGSVWGLLTVTSAGPALPPDTERRLTHFAEIAAAATSSAMASASLRRLADEQAALRRVAELVARGTGEERLFEAVTHEAAALMGDEATTLVRFVGERSFTILATHGGPASVGSSVDVPLDDHGVVAEILRTRRAARLDTYAASRPLYARDFGVRSSVAVPIVVDDRMWGLLGVVTTGHRLPPDTEPRLQQFADLAAVAIANAENKAQLTASRARVVATADETRRRLQRDVHDGAQQRLVQTVITLKLARAALAEGSVVADRVVEALHHAERASSELRDLVHGILPGSLTQGGLQTGLESLISDISVPVRLELDVPPLPLEIETTAYFIVAEALTNVVKHARASHAVVTVALADGRLSIDVTDDGIGSADPAAGSGLTGLADRVGAATGTLSVTSVDGRGTTLRAVLPLTPPDR